MLIDTHCHLDAAEFDADRSAVIAAAHAAGVAGIVIPAVACGNFAAVRDLAHATPGGAYALGIHPLYVAQADDDDLTRLREAVVAARNDPRFVAVGEIGLDFFVPEIAQGAPRARQERFYMVLKYLRRYCVPGGVPGGIAHAFNGSAEQARRFVDLGIVLGVGGAMTYQRALQIRRHATVFGLEHLVLETDAPDIPPAWLRPPDRRNTPAQVAGIARELAALRGEPLAAVIAATGATALQVLPGLRRVCVSTRSTPNPSRCPP